MPWLPRCSRDWSGGEGLLSWAGHNSGNKIKSKTMFCLPMVNLLTNRREIMCEVNDEDAAGAAALPIYPLNCNSLRSRLPEGPRPASEALDAETPRLPACKPHNRGRPQET